MKNVSRREFLAKCGVTLGTAAALDPVILMLDQILNSHLAMAQTSKGVSSVRNFVLVDLQGAPARWDFDYLLNPYQTDGSLGPNQNIVTRYEAVSDAEVKIKYETFAYRGVNFPTIWSTKIPTDSGAVAMTALADHAWFMRGVAMPDDGHTLNQERMISPALVEPSLITLVSRNSNQLLSNPNARTSITNLIAPLSRTYGSNFKYRATGEFGSVKAAIEGALKRWGDAARASGKVSAALYPQWSGIHQQLNDDFFKNLDAVVAEHAAATVKYQTLVNRCKNQAEFPVVGLTGRRSITFPELKTNRNTSKIPDATAGAFIGNSDLSTLITDASDFSIAQMFATAEVLIKRGLSKFVHLKLPEVSGLYCENPTDLNGVSGKFNSWRYDEHGASPYTSLVLHSWMYRSIAACIFRLCEQFKTAGIFNESIVMLGAEFGRRPGPNHADPAVQDFDTEHQGFGSNYTFFSGGINQPEVFGNIQAINTFSFDGYKMPPASQKVWGTSGLAAPVRLSGNQTRILTHQEFSSTICSLIGIPKVFPNFDPVMTIQDGKWVSYLDKAQNV
jgi:hypothetical protein